MRIVSYPLSGDWCEKLGSTEGNWVQSSGIISRDLIVKAYGEASIKVSGGYNYYLDAIWRFNDGYEFNGTLPNAVLSFLHALDEHFQGTCLVVLSDSAGAFAQKSFGTQPSQQIQFWEHSITLNPSDWIDSGVDWTNIKEVRIICDQNYAEGGNFWFDKFHFEYTEIATSLTINSQTLEGETVAKTASITSPTGYTDQISLPYGPKGVTPSGTWTIEIISSDFVKWENEDTNKQRTLILNGTPVTVTAYFSGGTPPNGKTSWLTIAIAGTLLLGLTVYYFVRKK